MSAALISLAMTVGAPLVRDILTKRIGAGNARLAEDVISLIAERAGVAPADLDRQIADHPQTVQDAISDVEMSKAPELVALYASELEFATTALEADQRGAGWKSAWRPAGMYMIGFLWLWNVVILHGINALAKTALPPVPFEQLLQLSALYFALYMGGHTVKDVVGKWATRNPGRGGVV